MPALTHPELWTPRNLDHPGTTTGSEPPRPVTPIRDAPIRPFVYRVPAGRSPAQPMPRRRSTDTLRFPAGRPSESPLPGSSIRVPSA
jgi:hypothetical protein